MNQVKQLKRALLVARMIEHAEGFLNTLGRYMAEYNNPDPAFDKIRIMLDRTWIENKTKKYTGIKNRLQMWNNSILARLSPSEAVLVRTPGKYCDLCSVEALIFRKTA